MGQQINWFSPHQMLTYNCLFNFVLGDRGGGKSFGTLEFGVNRWLKAGEQFIYLRRTERELKESQGSLFDALKAEGKFKQNQIYVKGSRIYCDKKVMGFTVALSTSMKRKSIPYPNVKLIIFEEFMVDGITSRYLGHGEQECELFENFYETVDRLRNETRVIFIANTFSKVNIYFTRYNIRIDEDKLRQYNRYNKNIMLCMWRDEGYREAKKKTTFYQITAGTEYSKHAYESDFTSDKNDFIRKRTPDSELNFGLEYQKQTYRVWADWDTGEYFVTTGGTVPKSKLVALSLPDSKPNNVNIRRVKNMPFMVYFKKAVDENLVYYDTLKAYSILHEIVYLLRTTK